MARKYASIESTICFNFGNLVRKVKAEVKKDFPKTRGEKYRKIMLDSLRIFRLNEQQFDYTTSSTHLGGVRWYVKCPKCSRPCLKLYLPTKYEDREQKYLCQHCHNLKNHSLLLGASSMYQKVFRPLKQLERIRRKLLKKSMTTKKAQSLLEEYERIERELALSPDYKLWKFQNDHGAPMA